MMTVYNYWLGSTHSVRVREPHSLDTAALRGACRLGIREGRRLPFYARREKHMIESIDGSGAAFASFEIIGPSGRTIGRVDVVDTRSVTSRVLADARRRAIPDRRTNR